MDLKDEPPKSEKPKEPRIKDDRGRDNSAPRGRSNKPPRMSRGSANNTCETMVFSEALISILMDE